MNGKTVIVAKGSVAMRMITDMSTHGDDDADAIDFVYMPVFKALQQMQRFNEIVWSLRSVPTSAGTGTGTST